MNDVLYNLYAHTGDPAHLATARRFNGYVFTAPLAAGQDDLGTLPFPHANFHLPEIVGHARAYELTGNATDKRVVDTFFAALTANHSYATGGSSSGECWQAPRDLGNFLSAQTQESCTQYNVLKIARRSFLVAGTTAAGARLADFYERALWNGILGNQKRRDPSAAGGTSYIYMLPQVTVYRHFMRSLCVVSLNSHSTRSIHSVMPLLYGRSIPSLSRLSVRSLCTVSCRSFAATQHGHYGAILCMIALNCHFFRSLYSVKSCLNDHRKAPIRSLYTVSLHMLTLYAHSMHQSHTVTVHSVTPYAHSVRSLYAPVPYGHCTRCHSICSLCTLTLCTSPIRSLYTVSLHMLTLYAHSMHQSHTVTVHGVTPYAHSVRSLYAPVPYGHSIKSSFLYNQGGVNTKPWGRSDYGFPCCWGTLSESFAKLTDSVFFAAPGGGLVINQFVSATVRLPDGVSVEQVSRFPQSPSETTTLRVRIAGGAAARAFPIMLRVPAWATRAADNAVTVNGAAVPAARIVAGRYLRLERAWRDGDAVVASFPMSLWTDPLNDRHPAHNATLAFMYGPLVLAGVHVDADVFVPRGDAFRSDPGGFIVRNSTSALDFEATGRDGRKMRMMALRDVVDERYVVYFMTAGTKPPQPRVVYCPHSVGADAVRGADPGEDEDAQLASADPPVPTPVDAPDSAQPRHLITSRGVRWRIAGGRVSGH